MPIYEYECLKCRKSHELMQKFSDPPLTVCPDCGGEVKKLISSTSFVLKGSGWYVTDYARKGSDKPGEPAKKEGAADAKEGAKSEAATEAKSESKPEPKPESKKQPPPAA